MSARNDDAPTINPLIAYVDQPDETAENVRNVLMFMADALGNQADTDTVIGDGARLILETCAAALDFHIDRPSVAAT